MNMKSSTDHLIGQTQQNRKSFRTGRAGSEAAGATGPELRSQIGKAGRATG